LFMGIWFATQSLFPINFVPTIFLIIIFIGVSKACLRNEPDYLNRMKADVIYS